MMYWMDIFQLVIIGTVLLAMVTGKIVPSRLYRQKIKRIEQRASRPLTDWEVAQIQARAEIHEIERNAGL